MHAQTPPPFQHTHTHTRTDARTYARTHPPPPPPTHTHRGRSPLPNEFPLFIAEGSMVKPLIIVDIQDVLPVTGKIILDLPQHILAVGVGGPVDKNNAS